MKKRVLALCLSLVLCVSLFPSALAAERTYEEAVAETLRNYDNSPLEVSPIYETELCSVFSYEIGGIPHGPYAFLALIYKAGSPLGEGTVINLPIPPSNGWGKTEPPERLELNEDKTSLSYSFYFRSPLYYDSDNSVRRAAGTFLYTVDLTTGKVSETVIPPTYQDILERHFPETSYDREQVLETPNTTVLLLRQRFGDTGYSLHLVDKGESADPRVRDLILPSTVISNDNLAWAPTDRAPDRLSLSEDGKTLTYVYSFPDELISPYYGTTLHEAGTYTYTVDLATGELSVDHTGVETPLPDQSGKFSDVPAGSWYEQGVTTCAQRGVMVGTGDGIFSPDGTLSTAECLTLALRLYDLRRGGAGTLEKAPGDWGKIILTFADGSALEGYGGYFEPFVWYNDEPGRGLNVSCEGQGETLWERELWAKAHEGHATVTVQGKVIPGSVDYHWNLYGDALFLTFYPDVPADDALIGEVFDLRAPAPDKWYRDAAYTAKTWGLLEDENSGFSQLLSWSRSDLEHSTDRRDFALALRDAAGTLEKKYSVETIHDFYNNESFILDRKENEGIYALYEAGILNGINEFGAFGGGETLTRAEAATMVARVLDESQRLTQAPDAPSAYDLAVAELRSAFGYYNERMFDTEECTVLLHDRGGFMRAPKGIIQIIYKPGSALGDGTVVSPPLKSNTSAYTSTNPDEAHLSEDGTRFIYSYRFFDEMNYPGEDAEDFSYDFWRHKCGIYTYTVDLATGETTEAYDPEVLITPEELEEADAFNFTIENTWDTPSGKVVLYRAGRDFPSDHDTTIVYPDYKLKLIYGGNSGLPAGTVKSFILPSTEVGQDSFNPTNREPDSVELSADGATLVYRYTFEKALSDESGVLLHDAGTYTYTVDLATGELSVTHTAD